MKTTTAFSKIARIQDRTRIIQGAGGSSKTYSILQYLIILCVKSKRKLTISIVSESFPHLRRGAAKDLIDILIENNLYNEANHNKTNNSYTLNGCTIEWFGVENGDKLRGARRDILFVNEANNIPREAFTQLSIRTKEFIFLDYNPSHLSWIKEYIKDDKSNFVKLTYKDNEFLSEAVIEEYKQAIIKAENGSAYWKNFVAVYVYGEEGQVDGCIYDYELIDDIPDDAVFIGSGLDFGFNDPNALVKVYRRGEKDLILDESLYKSGLLNNQIVNHILSDVQVAQNIVVCDSARPEIIAELKQNRIPAKGVTKGKGSILDGISIVQGFKLFVTKTSENLISEMNNYTWEKDNNGEKLNTPIDKHNHLLDAFRYIVMERLSSRSNNYNSLKWLR
ncbi:PBSX family phage terminase large subunit [Leeuwenhoekiella sp. NPDC079379]|uniref:PBSX family phage terminase large subunit n=1 Tax=Leeuwenhoekiella sp. NPDC079379 TaxID=3364122 RepID=UPI0037C61DDC